MAREDTTGGTVGYASSSKSPATIEKSRFSRTSLKLSYGPSWFDTLSIGVECNTVMERLGDYRDLVKALPRAVLVLLLYVTGGALCYGGRCSSTRSSLS